MSTTNPSKSSSKPRTPTMTGSTTDATTATSSTAISTSATGAAAAGGGSPRLIQVVRADTAGIDSRSSSSTHGLQTSSRNAPQLRVVEPDREKEKEAKRSQKEKAKKFQAEGSKEKRKRSPEKLQERRSVQMQEPLEREGEQLRIAGTKPVGTRQQVDGPSAPLLQSPGASILHCPSAEVLSSLPAHITEMKANRFASAFHMLELQQDMKDARPLVTSFSGSTFQVWQLALAWGLHSEDQSSGNVRQFGIFDALQKKAGLSELREFAAIPDQAGFVILPDQPKKFMAMIANMACLLLGEPMRHRVAGDDVPDRPALVAFRPQLSLPSIPSDLPWYEEAMAAINNGSFAKFDCEAVNLDGIVDFLQVVAPDCSCQRLTRIISRASPQGIYGPKLDLPKLFKLMRSKCSTKDLGDYIAASTHPQLGKLLPEQQGLICMLADMARMLVLSLLPKAPAGDQ